MKARIKSALTRLATLATLATLVAAGGCAFAPSHPSLANAQLPALIPVRDFVANRETTGGYSVSPDGKKMAWVGTSGFSPAVFVKTLAPVGGRDDTKAFVTRLRYYRWTADSRHLLAVADLTGDENAHIYAGAVEGSSTVMRDLTPFDNTNSHFLRNVDGSSDFLATSNRRDKRVFDVYRFDATTGKYQLMANNPGNVAWWGADKAGQLKARVLLEGDRSLLQVPEAGDGSNWKTTAEWSRFDGLQAIDFTADGESAWVLSNRGRDKMALVKLNLQTGLETVVFAVPDVDLDWVRLTRKTLMPLAAHSMPGYPQIDVFDADLKSRLQALAGGKAADIAITSIDDDERLMTVSVTTDRGGKTYLFGPDAKPPEMLSESGLSRMAPQLADTKPISFKSRDGLTLHGYLTLPVGVDPRHLPMVLQVHGGPWARDRWSPGNVNRSMQQFLANRGYAVLQVNYRGSSGYGREFIDRSIGESGGKMHEDLLDGVDWAIKAGIADPKRIAISGGSYGGYAALLGATASADVFACSVAFVAVSDMARAIETAPPYWELGRPWWYRYVGDPRQAEQRKKLDGRSPLFMADRAKNPVLVMHGVNDVRVKLEQSEMMVAALKKAGKEVEFVTFAGDGHGNQKWNNNLTMYRKTEDFLARCLGGRSTGFDYYQLGAWAF